MSARDKDVLTYTGPYNFQTTLCDELPKVTFGFPLPREEGDLHPKRKGKAVSALGAWETQRGGDPLEV